MDIAQQTLVPGETIKWISSCGTQIQLDEKQEDVLLYLRGLPKEYGIDLDSIENLAVFQALFSPSNRDNEIFSFLRMILENIDVFKELNKIPPDKLEINSLVIKLNRDLKNQKILDILYTTFLLYRTQIIGE